MYRSFFLPRVGVTVPLLVFILLALLGGIVVLGCMSRANSSLRKKPSPQTVHDFLSPDECTAVIRLAKAKGLSRSTVLDSQPVNSVRTSRGVFLSTEEPIVRRIFTRASKILDIPVENFEQLQVVNYKPGQLYKAHHDSCFKCDGGKDLLRIATLLVYLNDDFQGGHTTFPHHKVSVRPVRGEAVLFWNMSDDHSILDESLHEAEPVVKGVKWACNIWIHKKKIS
jgi:prolyl 4-hydroxylase